jgi:hypothetical protein
MATRSARPKPAPAARCAQSLEQAARSALESHSGRTLTDTEWVVTPSNGCKC